jgi:REP element-mobilizing transposase RayT
MQIPIPFPQKGGRPKKAEEKLKGHRSRPSISGKTPLHITVKLLEFFQYLRNKSIAKAFKKAIICARKQGLRIIHYSLQDGHAHIIVEADNNEILSSGMQAFGISFAKNVRKHFFENIKDKNDATPPSQVYKERYYIHILTTPREVKNAIAYVLRNSYRHGKTPNLADLFSSIVLIEDISLWEKLFGDALASWEHYFKNLLDKENFKNRLREFLDSPQSWLLKTGWTKA